MASGKSILLLLAFLLFSVFLTNCSQSSSGSSGDSSPDNKAEIPNDPEEPEDPEDPVDPPEEPALILTSCEGELALEATMDSLHQGCFSTLDPNINFAVSASGAENDRTWDFSNVSVILAANDATVKQTDCVVPAGDATLGEAFVVDFGGAASCNVVLADMTDLTKEAVYTLVPNYGITEESDLKSGFFATSASKFMLMKDIQLTPSSTAIAASFKGELNGGGYTISNLSIGNANSSNLGLIGLIELSADDPSVLIHNLKLEAVKLTASNKSAFLVGLVHSTSDVPRVEIRDVTIDFQQAVISCVDYCGGLVGSAETAVKMSRISAQGKLTFTGNFFRYAGGIIGHAKASEISDIKVTADLDLNSSYASTIFSVSAVAGYGVDSTFNDIDVSSNFTVSQTDNNNLYYFGGIIGNSDGSSVNHGRVLLTFTMASTKLLTRGGGVAGQGSDDTNISNVYAEVDWNTEKVTYTGGILGYVLSGAVQIENAMTSYVQFDTAAFGGIAGQVGDGSLFLDTVFATGVTVNGNPSTSSDAGQLIGRIGVSAQSVQVQNCHSYFALADETQPTIKYSLGNTSDTDAVDTGFTNCYTRQDFFFNSADPESQFINFTNVYAKQAQTKVQAIPTPFLAENLAANSSDKWVTSYNNQEYTYPMLKYPVDMKASVISEEEWYNHQINE